SRWSSPAKVVQFGAEGRSRSRPSASRNQDLAVRQKGGGVAGSLFRLQRIEGASKMTSGQLNIDHFLVVTAGMRPSGIGLCSRRPFGNDYDGCARSQCFGSNRGAPAA